MALKTSKVEVQGVTYNLKELSMAAQLRLEEIPERKTSDIIKECVVDWDLLMTKKEELSAEDYAKIVRGVNELNGWTRVVDS